MRGTHTRMQILRHSKYAGYAYRVPVLTFDAHARPTSSPDGVAPASRGSDPRHLSTQSSPLCFVLRPLLFAAPPQSWQV